jgi:hypothetical protein
VVRLPSPKFWERGNKPTNSNSSLYSSEAAMATAVRGRFSGGGTAASNGRDDSDNGGPLQPFDQRVRGRSVEEKLEAMRVAQKKYEEDLEDGELPSLQTSTASKQKKKTKTSRGLGGMMGGRLVNGHRTTTRPLSPPSQAGLVGVEEVVRNEAVRVRLPPAEVSKQRQFWSQFEREAGEDDGDDDEDDEEADHETEASGRHQQQRGAVAVDAEYYDDIPDDERLDRKITNIQRKVGAKNKRDDAAAAASEDYSSAAEPSTVDGSSSVDYGFADPDNTNLCAQTLTVLGDMCGIAPGIESSPTKKPLGSSRRRQIRSHVGEIEEEHTAIEVEFVEPDPAATGMTEEEDAPLDQRKNAYLSAMARKAKEEFQNRREDAPADERSAPAVKGAGSFTGGGASVSSHASSMGPKPAAATVSASAMSSASSGGGGGSVSSDVYNRFTASDKRKFLKLINSGLSPAEASEQVLQDRKAGSSNSSAGGASSIGKSPSRGGRGFGFWKRSPTKSADNEQLEGASDAVLATRIGSYGSQEFGSPVADNSSSSTSGGGGAGSGKVAVVPVPDLNELRVIDETAPESESDTEGMPFAKSGINYYDAIRRREQEDSDGDAEEFPATSTTPGTSNSSKGKARGLFAQKLLPRFTPLDDRRDTTPVRSRSAPREGGRRGAEEANVVQPTTEAQPRGEFASTPSATNRRAVSDTAHDAFADPELAAGRHCRDQASHPVRGQDRSEDRLDDER